MDLVARAFLPWPVTVSSPNPSASGGRAARARDVVDVQPAEAGLVLARLVVGDEEVAGERRRCRCGVAWTPSPGALPSFAGMKATSFGRGGVPDVDDVDAVVLAGRRRPTRRGRRSRSRRRRRRSCPATTFFSSSFETRRTLSLLAGRWPAMSPCWWCPCVLLAFVIAPSTLRTPRSPMRLRSQRRRVRGRGRARAPHTFSTWFPLRVDLLAAPGF